MLYLDGVKVSETVPKRIRNRPKEKRALEIQSINHSWYEEQNIINKNNNL